MALQCNSSLGSDGLTPEFYKIISHILSGYLYELFSVCLEERTIPSSLQLAKVILLEKQVKDFHFPESYQPISLSNVVYMIFTSILAAQLDSILPDYIHHDQSSYIRGRQLNDNMCKLCNIKVTCKIGKSQQY